MMGKLLKLEWLKMRRYRAFMVLVVLGVICFFGINYLVNNFVQELGEPGAPRVSFVDMFVGRPFDFPTVWHTVSFLSGFLLCISGLVVILLMAGEYTFRTARQNVIDGLSRAQFIDTKIALMAIVALGLTVVVAITGLLFGLVGEGAFSLGGVKYLGYFFVQALSHMSVALVVVMLLKRSGVSIGIYLLYLFIVENVVGVVLNNKVLRGLGDFLPVNSADELIDLPGKMGEIAGSAGGERTAPLWFLLAAVAWIVLCLGFCRWRFQRNDL